MTDQKTQEKTLKETLLALGHDPVQVETYNSYVIELRTAKNKKTGELAYPYAQNITKEKFIEYFEKVEADGLHIDGKHISIQSTGISYDYIAYKNKMLLAYPDTKIDMSLVFKDDIFSFEKKDGTVSYSHTIANPFTQKESDITGGYCVIKNARGEFLTLMSISDFEQHRKVAKQDYIWKAWMKEMCLKTLIKKACKIHFSDIYGALDEEDNKSNDITLPTDVEIEWKQEVEALTTLEALSEYYQKNAGRGKDFARLVTKRKKELSTTN